MKNIIPLAVIVLLLGIGGFVFLNSKNNKVPAVLQKTTADVKQSGESIFSTIQDALNKSISLKCEYPDPTGKTTITSYIKNGSVRVANIGTDKEKAEAIMKNNKMWIWTPGKKEGMMLTLDSDKLSITPGAQKENQREKIIAEMEKYKDYCKTAIVEDSLFNPPADVQFTDFTNLQNEMMRKVPSGIPQGIPSITIPAQEQPNE